MKKKDIGTEEVLYRMGLAAALVAAAGFFLWSMAPDGVKVEVTRWSFCVIYRFTGFLCPGCGGTRALTSLLQGHVVQSFLYHPLVPYGLGLYICFMGSHTVAKLLNGKHGKTWKTVEEAAPEGHNRPGRFTWILTGMKWKNGYLTTAVVLLVGNFTIKNLIHLITGADVLAVLAQWFGC